MKSHSSSCSAALVTITNARGAGIEIVQGQVLHLVQHRTSCRAARMVEILLHLMLAVDRNRAAAGELRHIDAVQRARKADVDSVMHQPLAPHAIAQTDRGHEVDHALLQNARAHTLDHVLFAARFEHHRIDSLEMEQMSEQKPGRTAADNAYLCTHAVLQQPFHFGDQIVLTHVAGPVGALVEIVPRRSTGMRAIKNQLLVDGVLRKQILIEAAHGAAQDVFLLEVVFLVELFSSGELHLQ